MSEGMVSVGVRELRQNLSVYLKRVAAGEAFEVTEHGHPVAMLAPLPKEDDPLERLIALGLATRPTGDLLDIEPLPPVGPGEMTLSEALQEQREERL